jgi:hypothetical protein
MGTAVSASDRVISRPSPWSRLPTSGRQPGSDAALFPVPRVPMGFKSCTGFCSRFARRRHATMVSAFHALELTRHTRDSGCASRCTVPHAQAAAHSIYANADADMPEERGSVRCRCEGMRGRTEVCW